MERFLSIWTSVKSLTLLPDRSVEELAGLVGKVPGYRSDYSGSLRHLCRGCRTRCRECGFRIADRFHLFLNLSTGHREDRWRNGAVKLCLPDPGAATASRRSPTAKRTKNNTGGATKNNSAASADMSATSDSLNSIVWATHTTGHQP